MWIIEGGRVQQSVEGGLVSASSSISVRSLGRSRTQTLSSLSTASPVTPPIFHLFGSGLGQSGSNLNFGAVSVGGAPRNARKSPAPKSTTQTANIEIPATLAQAFVGVHPVFTIPPPRVTSITQGSPETIPARSLLPEVPTVNKRAGRVVNL